MDMSQVVEYGQSISNDDVCMSRKEFHDTVEGEDDNSIRAVSPPGNLVTWYPVVPASEGFYAKEVSPYFPFSKALIFEEVVGR